VFLVVGLGNPGARYVDTRHNVGFLVVDALARRASVGLDREQSGAKVAKATVASEPAVLVKPQKFMNLSGGPVHAARDFYKVELGRILVVHDDLDLPHGDVRVKVGGGHGGHNGLRDLLAHVGADFIRIRVGIGRPPEGWDSADYVLGRWSPDQASELPGLVERAADAVEHVVRHGAAAAMQTFNSKPSPTDQRPTSRAQRPSGRDARPRDSSQSGSPSPASAPEGANDHGAGVAAAPAPVDRSSHRRGIAGPVRPHVPSGPPSPFLVSTVPNTAVTP
jgi:PTH1 family peptidyl-tRNA hydrolase